MGSIDISINLEVVHRAIDAEHNRSASFVGNESDLFSMLGGAPIEIDASSSCRDR